MFVLVPVIHVNSTNNKELGYIKLQNNEVLKYSDKLVTLIDGAQWFKLPLSEGMNKYLYNFWVRVVIGDFLLMIIFYFIVVNVSTESDESVAEVVQVIDGTETENIEISASNDTLDEETSSSTQVVLLEDGRIAYIQPVITEGN